ncbi:MAG: ASKHA domain-containing protein, partial [Clostridia bacterium]
MTQLISLTVFGRGAVRRLSCQKSERLLDALRRQQVYVSAACGGRGTCGQCAIRLHTGELAVTAEDQAFFSPEQLLEGYRLACCAYPKTDCTIEMMRGDETDFEVLAEQTTSCDTLQTASIAVDIGTTTLAFALVDEKTGRSVATHTSINHQRAFGADVISRIQGANEGKLGDLQQSIRMDILSGTDMLLACAGMRWHQITRVALAGNTTMMHLLCGYSCHTLGVAPFEPVNLDTVITNCNALLNAQTDWNPPAVLLPGFSTFVGGDIAAGLLACGMDRAERPCLFVDLGTNGEMALGNAHALLCASTAAGPAFEGGHISWGMGSVVGAICAVQASSQGMQCKTIADAPPIGICGTGMVDVLASLLKTGGMEDSGRLADTFFKEGVPLAQTADGRNIVMTQKDVRELQLAIAAVRAGIEILLKRSGTAPENVEKVWLAGGFGRAMDVQNAVAIGLLPRTLEAKVQAV